MTDNQRHAEITALEDACLGAAVLIDGQTPDSQANQTPEAENADPFMSIIQRVLHIRTEDISVDEHHDKLDEIWATVRETLDLPEGSFEAVARRGERLGRQLREPPLDDDRAGELVALAETDSGRTIWAVNTDGWDEDAFTGENTTFGMNPDGTIEPVEYTTESDDSET